MKQISTLILFGLLTSSVIGGEACHRQKIEWGANLTTFTTAPAYHLSLNPNVTAKVGNHTLYLGPVIGQKRINYGGLGKWGNDNKFNPIASGISFQYQYSGCSGINGFRAYVGFYSNIIRYKDGRRWEFEGVTHGNDSRQITAENGLYCGVNFNVCKSFVIGGQIGRGFLVTKEDFVFLDADQVTASGSDHTNGFASRFAITLNYKFSQKKSGTTQTEI